MTVIEAMVISNSTLAEIVSSYNITKEEYDALDHVLKEMVYYAGNGSRGWLGPTNQPQAVVTNELQIKILRLPLDRMPLFINSDEDAFRVISWWRLKIGR